MPRLGFCRCNREAATKKEIEPAVKKEILQTTAPEVRIFISDYDGFSRDTIMSPA